MNFTYLKRIKKVKIHARILIYKLPLLYIILLVQRSGQKLFPSSAIQVANLGKCKVK